MPLPPTRYIDAGPGVPLANPQTAMATGEAMARMGETIAQVGEKGFHIAEQVRKVEEAGKLSAFFANADEEAANFSTDLMTRSDTANWPTEWREKSTELRERMKSLGISPEGMARADIEFGEWSSSRSINFETQAATKALQMGRAQVSNALQYYGRRGDLDSYRREAARAKESGVIDPVEYDQALRDGDTLAAKSVLDEDIANNPREALKVLKSGEFLKTYPGATTDMVERGIREAEQAVREMEGETAAGVQDDVFSGKITDVSQLENDPRFKDLSENGNAKMAASIRGELEALSDQKVKDLRATDGYQARVIGKLAATMDDLKPNDVEKRLEMQRLISQLNPGVTKAKFSEDLRKRISGEIDDYSPLGVNLKRAKDAFKAGWFAKVAPVEINVAGAIDAGILKDSAKLKAAGFSDDQVKEFIEAKSDRARKDLLQANWSKRGKAADNVDPMVWATMEAIRDGKNTATLQDKKAQWDAAKTYGRVVDEVTKWAVERPEADDTTIYNKLLELASPGKRDEVIEKAFQLSDDFLDGGVLPPANGDDLPELDINFPTDEP